jgi:hypothetical protein
VASRAALERDLVPNTAEANRADPIVVLGSSLEEGPARVARAVVDEDHLPRLVERIERARQARDEIGDHGSFVPNRQHDAELHRDPIILQPAAKSSAGARRVR